MNKGTVRQRLFTVILLVSIGFLGVAYGMAAYKFQWWPYLLFRDAHLAAKAWHVRLMPRDRYRPDLYYQTRHTNIGISRYNKEKAYNGFTLFTSSSAQKAFLMSMDGQIVHEWHLPFSKVWKNPLHTSNPPVSDDFIFWRKAYLYPNGDILAIYAASGDTPWGYGLVKMDKDSNMIWRYAGRVHHDVDVGNDGKIYALVHWITTEEIPGIKPEPPLIEDGIVVLSANGQEIKRLSITEVVRHSDFSSLLDLPVGGRTGDLWHTNTVEVLDDQLADQFPFLKKGQVLISMREIDTIAVVDLDEEQVVWATRGPWHRQHDPDFLSSGNMLIFDNRGHLNKKDGVSRIVEFNPRTMETIWQYTGDEQDRFQSLLRAAQQRLPNGNTLITESTKGRIFEVTREKEVVWEFMSPFRAPNDNKIVAAVCWGQRFHPDSLNFEFNLKK